MKTLLTITLSFIAITALAAPIEVRQTREECRAVQAQSIKEDQDCYWLDNPYWADRYGTDVQAAREKVMFQYEKNERLKVEVDGAKRQTIQDATKLSDLPVDSRFDWSTSTITLGGQPGTPEKPSFLTFGITGSIFAIVAVLISIFITRKK